MLVLKFMFTINCAMCSLQQSFKKSGSAFPTPIMSPLNTISEEVSLLLRSKLLLNTHPVTYVSSYHCAFQGGHGLIACSARQHPRYSSEGTNAPREIESGQVTWRPNSNMSQTTSSGVYIIKMTSGLDVQTSKIMLIK